MRSAPDDLEVARIDGALDAGWGIGMRSIEYVPEGGGSHHWTAVDADGRRHFVTVDDLDDKTWLGDDRAVVFDGLVQALTTAALLRDSGLDFVVAPTRASDGEVLRRLDDRYTVSVFPHLVGRSYPFGVYPDAELRDRALDRVAALHRATPTVRDVAPHHVLGYGGAEDLHAFLAEPDRPWSTGPFGEDARTQLVPAAADLDRLAAAFDTTAARFASVLEDVVITHGEPHPANFLDVDGRLLLIDWDTTGLAAPERDLSLLATADGHDLDRYSDLTGRAVHPEVVTLYRLRWYLDDLGSAIRMFRKPHRDNDDTRRWLDAIDGQLQQLPTWLALVA